MHKTISNEEASKILEEALLLHLATSTNRYEGELKVENGSPLKLALNEQLNNLIIYWGKYLEYNKKSKELKAKGDEDNHKVYERAIALIEKLMKDEIHNRSIEDQRDLYEREHNIYNSRSYTEFPYELEGVGKVALVGLYYNEISSIANNMGFVLYELLANRQETYPDLAHYIMSELEYDVDYIYHIIQSKNIMKTCIEEFSGKDYFSNFCNLELLEDKIRYVREHIEITHISCMHLNVGLSQSGSIWCPKGKLDYTQIKSDHKFNTYADILDNLKLFLNGNGIREVDKENVIC